MIAQLLPDGLSWREAAAGCYSALVALAALVSAVVIIRKSLFETRKIQLEIAEKESTLHLIAALRPGLRPGVTTFSWKEKVAGGSLIAMNLAVLMFFGLTASPISGLEVLAMVFAGVSYLSIVGGIFFLVILRRILHQIEVDKAIVDGLRDLTPTLRAKKGES